MCNCRSCVKGMLCESCANIFTQLSHMLAPEVATVGVNTGVNTAVLILTPAVLIAETLYFVQIRAYLKKFLGFGRFFEINTGVNTGVNTINTGISNEFSDNRILTCYTSGIDRLYFSG